MNIDQWMIHLSEAYESIGLPFSPEKKALLLAELSESRTQAHEEIMAEAIDTITRFFFRKATHGETFGPVGRIKEAFGRSLEENYGLSTGPFLNMAKTYWTYEIEVEDLFPEHHNLTLTQILKKVEHDIASVFFPTAGPITIPVSQRREAQRRLLQKYAPGIDIKKFLSDNPILRVKAKRGGCLGMISITLIIVVFSLILWFLSRLA